MSGRRSRSRGRSRGNRSHDCYREVSGGLDGRPDFDTTPFDSSKGGSVWETLSTESIFDSKDGSTGRSLPGSPPGATCLDWYCLPQHNDFSPSRRGTTASGYSGTTSPMLKRGINRIKPSSTGMTSGPSTSRPSPYSSCQDSDGLGSYGASAGPSCDDDDDDFFSKLLSSEYIPRKIIVDTTP